MTYITATHIAPARRNPLVALFHRYEEWNNKRALRRVLDLDDHILRDIGLTHGDVDQTIADRMAEDAGRN